jgi:hypothetical protein
MGSLEAEIPALSIPDYSLKPVLGEPFAGEVESSLGKEYEQYVKRLANIFRTELCHVCLIAWFVDRGRFFVNLHWSLRCSTATYRTRPRNRPSLRIVLQGYLENAAVETLPIP